jgi:hypothetical protein
MQKLKFVLRIAATLSCIACQPETEKQDTSASGVASKNGKPVSLPADVLLLTKPLISGELYSNPDFGSPSVARFDTAQQIQLLDTTDGLFMKARIYKNTQTFTGYISKAILPEWP